MHLGLIRFLRSIFPAEIINLIILHEARYFLHEVAVPHWSKVVNQYKSTFYSNEEDGRMWLKRDTFLHNSGLGIINFRNLGERVIKYDYIHKFIAHEPSGCYIPFNYNTSLPSDHLDLYYNEKNKKRVAVYNSKYDSETCKKVKWLNHFGY